jgi:hypothetical protein
MQVPCQTAVNFFTRENKVNLGRFLVITITDQAET